MSFLYVWKTVKQFAWQAYELAVLSAVLATWFALFLGIYLVVGDKRKGEEPGKMALCGLAALILTSAIVWANFRMPAIGPVLNRIIGD